MEHLDATDALLQLLDLMSIEDLVRFSQLAHTASKPHLRNELHQIIGERYAKQAPTTTDTPYQIGATS